MFHEEKQTLGYFMSNQGTNLQSFHRFTDLLFYYKFISSCVHVFLINICMQFYNIVYDMLEFFMIKLNNLS